MNNTANGGGKLLPASMLIDSGMPVFSCKLNRAGDPLFPKDARWQETPVDPDVIDSYRDGRALCAVTGVVYDVLDIDPRNGGGPSFQKLFAELGRDLPNVIWKVETPSGGIHLYVDSLGIGSFTGFMPGLDLKGGLPDGTSRGFVFLPPTVRPSKDARKPGRHEYGYKDLPALEEPEVCSALRDAILKHDAERKLSGIGYSGRQDVSLLRTAAVEAQAGEQRPALLRLVHEYERKGYEASDIVTLLLSLGVRNFDSRKPWTARDFRGLLHAPGRVVGDAAPGEMDGIEQPITRGLMRSFAEVGRKGTKWVVKGYLALGEMTILDGEKGVGKSIVIEDWAAHLSRGESVPGLVMNGPVHVAIFCSESSAEGEIGPRLDAAGAVVSYIHCPEIVKTRRGKAPSEWVLPDSADKFQRAIRECGASVAVWDPINDFMAEDIQTHNDASIRRALGPLGRVLAECGCAGLLVRHLNKNVGASASMRGSGSTAYQNRARIHLMAAKLPSDYEVGRGRGAGGGRFGLAIVDSNMRRVQDEVLAYDIVDSARSLDPSDPDCEDMVPVVEWYGTIPLSADELVNMGGGHKRMGPRPIMQEQIEEVLSDMFERRDTWPAAAIVAELKAAGCATDQRTMGKVKASMGIRSVRRTRRGAHGVVSWDWTIRTVKGSVRSAERADES